MGFSSNSKRASIPAYLFLAALAATLATLGCQGVQKASFVPPAQAQAPALVAASNPPEQPKAKPQPADAPQPKLQVAQALQVDPIGDLIARVEKEYQTGQDNYKDGHLEAAKQNFDNAFNQLLGSGFDLKADDRLQHE